MKEQSGEFREPKPLRSGPSRRPPRLPSGLCDRLRAACDGLTLREVASLTGASKEAVRRYLAGSPPSADFLAQLCKAKGLSAEWLLCGLGSPGRAQQRRAALGDASLDELYHELRERVSPVLDAAAAQLGRGEQLLGGDRAATHEEPRSRDTGHENLGRASGRAGTDLAWRAGGV